MALTRTPAPPNSSAHSLGQQVQRRLAGAVDAGIRRRCAGGDGADVDDAAVSALDHAGHQLLHQDVRRPHVGVEMGVEVGVVGVDVGANW